MIWEYTRRLTFNASILDFCVFNLLSPPQFLLSWVLVSVRSFSPCITHRAYQSHENYRWSDGAKDALAFA